MGRRSLVRLSISLCAHLALFATASNASTDTHTQGGAWVEARSSHFRVVSNAGIEGARRVARELEQVRSIYATVLEGARLDSGAPLLVFAVKGEEAFDALLPPPWLEKGRARLDGLFLHGMYGYFILLRLDGRGEHGFRTVYHEYFHYLARRNLAGIPPWLNEGLAEYWETIEIGDRQVRVGRPQLRHLGILRDTPELPMETLLTVHRGSPHYREQGKTDVFY